ncbi:Glutathione hydrolase 1 proenzyme [Lamellibrachia satsuma]|nr:Glutathione hydrolase 1 proenzyme [Lamellibrachia satsuma]
MVAVTVTPAFVPFKRQPFGGASETFMEQPLHSISAKYRYAAAGSDSEICSQIATDILGRRGGSAVDAAIAGILCVGVVQPHSSGIGGGALATVYDTPRNGKEKLLVNIMFRETAPSAAHRDMFVNNLKASTTGGLAVGTPGEVKGLYTAWKMFGRAPWKVLFAPAICLCEEGVPVFPYLASTIQKNGGVIRKDAHLRRVFVNEDDTLKKTGDIMRRPLLGRTLRRIADDPDTFYNGSLASDIVSDLQERDSIITLQDLANYTAKIKTPLNITLRRNNGNFTIFSPPPPSGGAVYLFILNILKGYKWSNQTLSTLNGRILSYHRIAEAFKFAYAKRSQLGDEDFLDLSQLVANMTSDSYAANIRELINDKMTQNVSYYGGSYEGRTVPGTTHFNVLAQDGGAVSVTSTINTYFGSKVLGRKTGIIFNNEMDDFSTPGSVNFYGVPASPSNFISPGKMPMSSTCPTLVLDDAGNVRLATGGAGGTRITTHTAWVTIQHLMFERSIKEATDAARIHHQLVPNILHVEPGITKAERKGLMKKGHVLGKAGLALIGSITSKPAPPSAAPAAYCGIDVVSDGRKPGSVCGF